ncbi:MAG: radical SAM-associated putative lipoprotein, partial [Bacteroidales bacterium]|nr:radical SAM-associated putative lipoprotein [Bacteroidales bacterium]
TPDVIFGQNDWYENDTLYTDSNGAYELSKTIFDKPKDVRIVFEDIDGAENGGEFESAEAAPEIKRTKKGDKSWYGGAFEVQADVTLKKK